MRLLAIKDEGTSIGEGKEVQNGDRPTLAPFVPLGQYSNRAKVLTSSKLEHRASSFHFRLVDTQSLLLH